jgi:hypothetical protein
MININTHKDLYRCNPEDYIFKSLDFAKSLPVVEANDVNIHFFWKVPGVFGRKQLLPIKSAIATQNLNTTKIILWSNVDLSDNEYLKPYLKYIDLKIWDLQVEAKNTILEDCQFLNNAEDGLRYLDSDIFRLLCLHKYGGFYCDMDMVLLRDLNPLTPYQFAYQWSASGVEAKIKWAEWDTTVLNVNNAIVNIHRGSKLSLDLLNTLKHTRPQSQSNCWGRDLLNRVIIGRDDCVVFPCAWFNTEWLYVDKPILSFSASYEAKDKEFDGAFTWHWHNQWGAEIEEHCKFYNLEQKIERLFIEKGL